MFLKDKNPINMTINLLRKTLKKISPLSSAYFNMKKE